MPSKHSAGERNGTVTLKEAERRQQKALAQASRRRAKGSKRDKGVLSILLGFAIFFALVAALLVFKPSKSKSAPRKGSAPLKAKPPAPAKKAKSTPKSSIAGVDFNAQTDRKLAIEDAFAHSWQAYETQAWGADEYHPISQRGSNMSAHGGYGYFIIDCLDSIILMGDRRQYNHAREFVSTLSFDRDGIFSVFETTIRILGGLLSAYHLTPDAKNDRPLYLRLAVDLADRLLPAFDTPTGIPLSSINLATGVAYPDTASQGAASLAEATTIQLEFKYLSHISQDRKYWDAAERVMDSVRKAEKQEHLAPILIDPIRGQFQFSDIRLGSRGDSYYEYLIKQYIQTAGTQEKYKEDYKLAVAGIQKHLVRQTVRDRLVYLQEISPDFEKSGETQEFHVKRVHKMDHLVCFASSMLLLGLTGGQGPFPFKPDLEDEEQKNDWNLALRLLDTCVATYSQTTTGLGPEIMHFYLPEDIGRLTIGRLLVEAQRDDPERLEALLDTEELQKALSSEKGPKRDWWIKGVDPVPLEHDMTSLGEAINEWRKEGDPAAIRRVARALKAGMNPVGSGQYIDGRNVLRPETVESLYYAWRVTGDNRYRDWAWQIFQSFRRHCYLPAGGYSGIENVDAPLGTDGTPVVRRIDKMETFWISETLKYLWLTFNGAGPGLDAKGMAFEEIVFNTEGHALPIFRPQW